MTILRHRTWLERRASSLLPAYPACEPEQGRFVAFRAGRKVEACRFYLRLLGSLPR